MSRYNRNIELFLCFNIILIIWIKIIISINYLILLLTWQDRVILINIINIIISMN